MSEFGYCRSCQSRFPTHKQMAGGRCPVCGWKYDETFTETDDRTLAAELAACLREVDAVYGAAFDEVSGGLHIPKGAVKRFDAAFEKVEAVLKKAAAAGIGRE